LFSFYLLTQMTVELDFLRIYGSPQIEGRGHRSRAVVKSKYIRYTNVYCGVV